MWVGLAHFERLRAASPVDSDHRRRVGATVHGDPHAVPSLYRGCDRALLGGNGGGGKRQEDQGRENPHRTVAESRAGWSGTLSPISRGTMVEPSASTSSARQR